MTRAILVVDDEQDFGFFLKKNLEAAGDYAITVCHDSRQALAHAKALRPSAILLDVLMPGLSGPEVAEQLADDSETRAIPVVFLTAVVTDEEASKPGGAIGRHQFIAKPVQLRQVLKVLDQVCRGFTLIELMLVVVIIAALAAMVVPRLAGRSEEAKVGIAKADIKGNVAMALRLYEVDNGRYPTTEQGLRALLQKPTGSPAPANWKGPYLEQEPLDPWGRPYVYRCPGAHPPRDYDLSSLGSDGTEGGDDVTNW